MRPFSINSSIIFFAITGLLLFFFSYSVSANSKMRSDLKVDQIVVYKSDRQMLLIRDGYVVKQYRIALGRQPKGHKLREGDHRTPEGTYYIQARNPKSRYYLSLKISYPNATDKERARKQGLSPGGEIMIHGMNDKNKTFWGRLQDWTQGCIAVHNAEIEEIWEMVAVGTPIRILP